MKLRALLPFLIICSIAVSSCNKKKLFEKLDKGVVHWTGDENSGGCGYMIEIESVTERYKPLNLPIKYAKDGQKIKLSYTASSTKYNCGSTDKTTINIITIKKSW